MDPNRGNASSPGEIVSRAGPGKGFLRFMRHPVPGRCFVEGGAAERRRAAKLPAQQ